MVKWHKWIIICFFILILPLFAQEKIELYQVPAQPKFHISFGIGLAETKANSQMFEAFNESTFSDELIGKIIDAVRDICKKEVITPGNINKICSCVGSLKRESIKNMIKKSAKCAISPETYGMLPI